LPCSRDTTAKPYSSVNLRQNMLKSRQLLSVGRRSRQRACICITIPRKVGIDSKKGREALLLSPMACAPSALSSGAQELPPAGSGGPFFFSDGSRQIPMSVLTLGSRPGVWGRPSAMTSATTMESICMNSSPPSTMICSHASNALTKYKKRMDKPHL
jgi:hypothetical protein